MIFVLFFLVLFVSSGIEIAADSAGTAAGLVARVVVGVLTGPLSALAAAVLYFELRGTAPRRPIRRAGATAAGDAARHPARRTRPTPSATRRRPTAPRTSRRRRPERASRRRAVRVLAMPPTIDATTLLRPACSTACTCSSAQLPAPGEPDARRTSAPRSRAPSRRPACAGAGRARVGVGAPSDAVRCGRRSCSSSTAPASFACDWRRRAGAAARSSRERCATAWTGPGRRRERSPTRRSSTAGGRADRLPRARAAPGGARGATHADAARAGLENLARTLSIEWARYAITLVAIAPGRATPAQRGGRAGRLPRLARRRVLLGLPARSARSRAAIRRAASLR